MSDFLLELLCEEIPARMQDNARNDLERLFTAELTKAGLKAAHIATFATPRRLALIASGLPVNTDAVSEEFKGPRTSAPDQALEGFLRKTGLTKDQLEDRDGVWFAVVEKPGQTTTDVLAEAIPAIIRAFPWPKSMRWGVASASTEMTRWVRPLQGIVALFGDDVVSCEVAGVRSGHQTAGHRFHATGPVTITSAATYAEQLRAAYVIVDQGKRQALIEARAKALAEQAGYSLIEDAGLVAENAGLTEWPVPLLGRFDPEFLEVPPEVIQLTLRINQKYFVLRDADGKLAPAFICTANINASDDGAAIIAGNGKVLAARLSDARFFWEQDKKTSLAEHAKKLERITFHEKLGTVADRVKRIKSYANLIAQSEAVHVDDVDAGGRTMLYNHSQSAALLSKADLVTEMVGEFPELQGLMGGYYARVEGLPEAVADAIRDQYGTPSAPVSVVLALADKFDILQEFFAINERPTGSKDPFALRRAAIQILFIIMRGLRINLTRFLSQEVIEFIVERWMAQNRSAGGRADLIAAVTTDLDGDLYRTGQRMRALETFLTTPDGANLLAGYKRAANILKKEELDPAITPAPHSELAEIALAAALDSAEPRAAGAIEAEDFAGAMAALATLRAPIDAFFNDVTVNDADPAKRAARLALLERVRAATHKVADFSRIEG